MRKRRKRLEDAGFDPDVETRNSAAVEEGLVIYSEPSGGTTATNGSPVTVFVSSGPKLTKVPVLVGSQRRLAVQQIRGRGLTPSVSEEESAAPAGEVISQSPSAGSEVEPGSTVSIVVSSGEEQAQVPNVIGKLRAGRGAGGSRRRPQPERGRRRNRPFRAKSAARSTSSRRPGPSSNPATR